MVQKAILYLPDFLVIQIGQRGEFAFIDQGDRQAVTIHDVLRMAGRKFPAGGDEPRQIERVTGIDNDKAIQAGVTLLAQRRDCLG